MAEYPGRAVFESLGVIVPRACTRGIESTRICHGAKILSEAR